MKTAFTPSAALALALTATAPLNTLAASFNEPTSGYGTIKYGESFTLKFTGDGSPVYIGIAAGPSNDVKEVTSLTSGYKTLSSDSFTTSIPKGSLPQGKYSFTITTEKSPINYSSSFCVESCKAEAKAETVKSKVESKIAKATDAPKKQYEKVKQEENSYYQGGYNATSSATATGVMGYSATGTGASYGGSGITPFTGAAAKVGAGVAGIVCAAAGLVGGLMML